MEETAKAKQAEATAAAKAHAAKVQSDKTDAKPAKAAKTGDNLKIVEGIGPKIEEHLNAAGITTFAQLADASIETLQEILDNAGSAYKIHDPSTWADQAAMARDGKMDELKAWQDQLNGGKE